VFLQGFEKIFAVLKKNIWRFESKAITFAALNRGMEQLVARRAHNPKVVGSSPAPATK
jgi:hypothetical protein